MHAGQITFLMPLIVFVIEPWIWFQPKDMVLVINQTHTQQLITMMMMMMVVVVVVMIHNES